MWRVRAGSTTTDYQYRADGMRTKKIGASSTDWFYYDGQMPIETAEVGSSSTVVTRNGLGARGIDRIERVGTSTTVGYPIYDGHGNMIATLSKSGSSYSVGDLRSYDAWGVIRSGNTTGDPKGRYCANLGHVDDDESGLTYMRARYYESGSGRFVSEDPTNYGWNWYIYCAIDPINLADTTGRVHGVFIGLFTVGTYLLAAAALCAVFNGADAFTEGAAHLGMICFAAALSGCEHLYDPVYGRYRSVLLAVASEVTYYILTKTILQGIHEAASKPGSGFALGAVLAVGIYAMTVMAALIANDAEGRMDE